MERLNVLVGDGNEDIDDDERPDQETSSLDVTFCVGLSIIPPVLSATCWDCEIKDVEEIGPPGEASTIST